MFGMKKESKQLRHHVQVIQRITAIQCPRAERELKNGKGKIVKKVSEPWTVIDKDEDDSTFTVVLHVPMPYSVNDLEKQTDAIFAAVGRPIQILNLGGVAVVVIGKLDFKDKVPFEDEDVQTAIKSLMGRQILIGMDIHGMPVFHDFKIPHLMFAGQSGYGKTDFARFMLYQLISRFSPDELEIYIIDMKGFSFLPFRNIPHVKKIARDLPSAVSILAEAYVEMQDRAKSVWASGKRDTAKAFKWRVVLIDEGSQISPALREGKVEKALAKLCWQYAGAISCIGREAGIGVLFGTQYPTAEVIRGQIKANMDAVICFKTQNQVHSNVAIDRSDAALLPHGVAGRAIIKDDDLQVQVPFVGDDDAWDKLLEPFTDPNYIVPLEGEEDIEKNNPEPNPNYDEQDADEDFGDIE